MAKKIKSSDLQNLPSCAVEFIKLIVKKMRYRKKVRADVMSELAAHFEDELKDCSTDEEKKQKAQQLITDFGDVKLLAVLLRRAKKRCRPLWRTVVARTFQTIGVLILCLILYVVWFLTGKPAITTNYVAELNRIVRPVSDENLNAAPLYEKAAELVDKIPYQDKEILSKVYNEPTSEQKLLIEKWLNENKEALELIVAGSKKPYFWRIYGNERNPDMINAILLPNLDEFRSLAYALRWRAQLRAEQGLYEDAFNDLKSCYRFGRHLRGDKFLIEQLVGIAIESLAIQAILNIISEHQIDSVALAALQQDLEQIIAGEDFVISLTAEKMCLYDELQRCFTKDRLGGGHLYFGRLKQMWPMIDSDPLGPIFRGGWTAPLHILFTHPNKQETREMIDCLFASWDTMARKTPAQIRAEEIDIEKQAMEMVKGNLLLEILVPALGKVCEISYRLPVDVQATLTILAALRYKQDLGQYPEDLNELITTGYLKELPMDYWTDKPLVYKKTDDSFILYSVGPNFIDDGGEVARDKKDRPKKWADQGDVVFWPVVK